MQVFLVTGSGWWGHPEDYECVTQNAVPGVEADPGACGCVKPGEVSGMWGHHGDYGHVNPGAGSGRVFTLETMNM